MVISSFYFSVHNTSTVQAYTLRLVYLLYVYLVACKECVCSVYCPRVFECMWIGIANGGTKLRSCEIIFADGYILLLFLSLFFLAFYFNYSARVYSGCVATMATTCLHEMRQFAFHRMKEKQHIDSLLFDGQTEKCLEMQKLTHGEW